MRLKKSGRTAHMFMKQNNISSIARRVAQHDGYGNIVDSNVLHLAEFLAVVDTLASNKKTPALLKSKGGPTRFANDPKISTGYCCHGKRS